MNPLSHITVWLRLPDDPPEKSIGLHPVAMAVGGRLPDMRRLEFEMTLFERPSLLRLSREPYALVFFGIENTKPGHEYRRLYFFRLMSVCSVPFSSVGAPVQIKVSMEFEEVAPHQTFPTQ